jgi:hypothetical protein
MIELVDFNDLYNGGKKEAKKAKVVGGKAKKADDATEAAAVWAEMRQQLMPLNNYENNHSILKDAIYSLSLCLL